MAWRWRADDALLFLGLGAFTFIGIRVAAYGLRDVLNLTQIHEQPRTALCTISQETEDALDARSLAVLAESHDRPTSQAAIRILSDRFVRNPKAITALAADLYSTIPATRAQGKLLLKLLESHASDQAPIRFLSENVGSSTRRARSTLFQVIDRGISQAREREESVEEQEVRRRRRQAMVLHEGGGPVSQDDIIQRNFDRFYHV